MVMNKDNEKIKLSFAAINQVLENNVPSAEEKEIRGQNFITFGSNNKFPEYLYSLYLNVTTLNSIINGCVDYICGDEIISNIPNISSDKLTDIVKDIALSYLISGNVFISVLRNKIGDIYSIENLDFRFVRSNKDNTVLYYSEDFLSKSFGRCKCIAYPKFGKDDVKNANSIYFYKNNKFNVYGLPIWNGAIKCCEIEKSIDEYHLNNINSGFMGSVLVSLNNGVPEDSVKEEIEKNFNEKFCGKENSGRIVISYSEDKEHAAEIKELKTEDFSERYNSLAKRSKEGIFTSFRATPSLFGIPTDDKGFSQEQYKDQYALFYTSVIKPIQKTITKIINDIFGDNSIEIKPFTVGFESGKTSDENVK